MNKLQKFPALAAQFGKFGVVGLIGTFINVLIFNLLISMHWFDVHYLYANTAAFLCAVTHNFYWHHHWTFKQQNHAAHTSPSEQFIKFFLVSFASFALNSLLLTLFVHAGFSKFSANILAIGIACATNFVGSRCFAFRASIKQPEPLL